MPNPWKKNSPNGITKAKLKIAGCSGFGCDALFKESRALFRQQRVKKNCPSSPPPLARILDPPLCGRNIYITSCVRVGSLHWKNPPEKIINVCPSVSLLVRGISGRSSVLIQTMNRSKVALNFMRMIPTPQFARNRKKSGQKTIDLRPFSCLERLSHPQKFCQKRLTHLLRSLRCRWRAICWGSRHSLPYSLADRPSKTKLLGDMCYRTRTKTSLPFRRPFVTLHARTFAEPRWLVGEGTCIKTIVLIAAPAVDFFSLSHGYGWEESTKGTTAHPLLQMRNRRRAMPVREPHEVFFFFIFCRVFFEIDLGETGGDDVAWTGLRIDQPREVLNNHELAIRTITLHCGRVGRVGW